MDLSCLSAGRSSLLLCFQKQTKQERWRITFQTQSQVSLYFPSVSSLHIFSVSWEWRKLNTLLKWHKIYLRKLSSRKKTFNLNIHFFSASLSWGISYIDSTELKTENLHLDRNLRKDLLHKLSCITFFLPSSRTWTNFSFLFLKQWH